MSAKRARELHVYICQVGEAPAVTQRTKGLYPFLRLSLTLNAWKTHGWANLPMGTRGEARMALVGVHQRSSRLPSPRALPHASFSRASMVEAPGSIWLISRLRGNPPAIPAGWCQRFSSPGSISGILSVCRVTVQFLDISFERFRYENCAEWSLVGFWWLILVFARLLEFVE